MTAPTLRRDLVTDRWVLVAPGRRGSPRDFGAAPLVRDAGACPFCAGHESATSSSRAERLDASGRWLARAFANLFPMVSPGADPPPVEGATHDTRAAVGDHEVIVETPDHGVDLAELGDDHARAVVDLYRDRFRALAERPDARAVLLFKNRGPRSGASLTHAHGQVLSLSTTPPGTWLRDRVARRHHAAHGASPVAEARDRELRAGVRVVERAERFSVFCPFAPHRSFETWIVPNFASASLASLADDDLAAFAPLLVRTLARVLRATGGGDYNVVVRTPARRHWSAPWAQWHCEVLPRRGGDAGFELTSGMQCVLTTPEESAAILREA